MVGLSRESLTYCKPGVYHLLVEMYDRLGVVWKALDAEERRALFPQVPIRMASVGDNVITVHALSSFPDLQSLPLLEAELVRKRAQRIVDALLSGESLVHINPRWVRWYRVEGRGILRKNIHHTHEFSLWLQRTLREKHPDVIVTGSGLPAYRERPPLSHAQIDEALGVTDADRNVSVSPEWGDTGAELAERLAAAIDLAFPNEE